MDVLKVEIEIATGFRWYDGAWVPSLIVSTPNRLLAIKVIRERTACTLVEAKMALYNTLKDISQFAELGDVLTHETGYYAHYYTR